MPLTRIGRGPTGSWQAGQTITWTTDEANLFKLTRLHELYSSPLSTAALSKTHLLTYVSQVTKPAGAVPRPFLSFTHKTHVPLGLSLGFRPGMPMLSLREGARAAV